MKNRPTSRSKPLASLRLAISASFFLSLLNPLTASADEILQVFLQGASAAELTELVEANGGAVTHSLHIIDAVGAKLTGQQLANIAESPLVARFIDDLADSEVPGKPEEEKDAPPCRVRGHIELDFVEKGVSWKLYNKYEKAAAMSSLTLDWPDSLGEIKTLHIGDTVIDRSRYAGNKQTTLSLEFAEKEQPIIEGMERLDIAFTNPAKSASSTPPQRDFTMEASFVGPCTTKLVPGYENNHEDYYYNTAGGVDDLHKQGLTGKGVTVAIIDSGLWEHELLRNDTNGKNRLLATYDAITDTEGGEALDESGHGTHMASIIANSGKTLKNGEWTGTYKGVAPDANLVAVKVLDRQGLAHLLDIVRGVQWVVDNRAAHSVSVLNLSFSKEPKWKYWEDPVNQAVIAAWDAGIFVVAAAGNTGPSSSTVGSPGNTPEIITIGLLTDAWTPKISGDDYIPKFSSRGPTASNYLKPELVAVGGHMTGLIPPLSDLGLKQPEDKISSGEFVSTGSSQAAAFVTGVSALILQSNTEISPVSLKCFLSSSAEPAILQTGRLAYSPLTQGYGALRADRALIFGDHRCQHLAKRWGTDGQNSEFVAVDKNGGYAMNVPSGILPPSIPAKPWAWGAKSFVEETNRGEARGDQDKEALRFWQDIYLQEKNLIKRLVDEVEF